MADIYLIKYSVKGIKAIDQLVSLSFYKKIIPKNADTQAYNIKGIYGMNGSGKSGIITSVEILKNLLIDSDYLNNPIVQKNLDAIINKIYMKFFSTIFFYKHYYFSVIYFKYCMHSITS